jgi:MFS family permease
MLIAGRGVQGIGSGGINMIVEVIIGDLVPLRQRGNYMAIILSIYSVGVSLGPFVGGIIVQTTSWRWVCSTAEAGRVSILINMIVGFLHQSPRGRGSLRGSIRRPARKVQQGDDFLPKTTTDRFYRQYDTHTLKSISSLRID